jgi:glycosyltransferase involved in cell wall biosynthesis
VFERQAVRRSRVVIVICQELARLVREIDPAADPVLIENAPGASEVTLDGAAPAVRRDHAIGALAPLVVYTGTFEAYQGLDLLLDAMVLVVRERHDVRLLLAGGTPGQIEAVRAEAHARGLNDQVLFAGERPAAEIPAFLEAADVLVSPRSRGTNTPLKIYQYLRAGRAIVATRLLTHTQVLDDHVAVLTSPDAQGFADGILRALGNPAAAALMGERAAALAATKYSYDAYLARTRAAMARLGAAPAEQVAGRVA